MLLWVILLLLLLLSYICVILVGLVGLLLSFGRAVVLSVGRSGGLLMLMLMLLLVVLVSVGRLVVHSCLFGRGVGRAVGHLVYLLLHCSLAIVQCL